MPRDDMSGVQCGCKSAGRLRLSSKQWDDVADLCNEAAVACETGYENHDWQARQKAAKWMMALAMKAQDNAEAAQEKLKKPQNP